MFIVGIRHDVGGDWSFPRKTHSEDALLWNKWRSWDYWKENGIEGWGRLEVPRAQAARVRRMKEKPELRPWKTVRDAISDLPEPQTKTSKKMADPNHYLVEGARIYHGHTGSPLDEPAKALKAGDHGVPGGENMLRRADGSVRYFSVRESARLQTFPDEFQFCGSWTESMRQLGNAVPVDLAQLVAQSVLEQLKGPST